MDSELWRRVKALAADAWERPPADRADYVAARCGDDDGLRREVLSLIGAMEHAGDRLDAPALDASGVAEMARVVDDHRSVLIGDRLGPWTLVREVGQGGMGTVYLAERAGAEFGQRAAVKIVRGGGADDLLVRRFRDERRILATLEHPHIARLIDGGATPHGLPYVVMEYVEGLPIDLYCEQHALDFRRRIDLFRRVCQAVHYAHQHLIVHRDIKASNILVTADGVPKLLDFGIAKVLEREGPAEATIVRMITPESASPEQLRGEPITTATDVYALGVLLYRLATGRSPYRLTSGSDAELIDAVCVQEPVSPGTIDADVDRIILKALRKDPERRYGGADQLSDDLQRSLEGRPVLAAPDSRAYRMRKFVTRHRLSLAAAALVVLAIAGGSAATIWQARVAARERDRAGRQFNAVRTLAGSVLGELHDAVATLAGSTPARELLLRRATEYLDTLSREASGSADLQRELAAGYRRLAQVQGTPGLSNVGDVDAAVTSYRKAVALLEPLAARGGETRDRAALANAYVSLASMETSLEERRALNRQAVALLEAVPAAERTRPDVIATAVRVWYFVGRERLTAKQYEDAYDAFVRDVEAAEAALTLEPESPAAGRNLALALQQLGTTLEMLKRRDEAIAAYRRALALDRDRAGRLKDSADARLDLSFSYGALGAALMSSGDIDGAREQYQQAIALRQAVADADPDNDRATQALAYGHQRMAWVEGKGGNVDAAVASHERALIVYRQRADAHPERDHLWSQYSDALFQSAGALVELLERHPPPGRVRRQLTTRVERMLDDLVVLRGRWRTDQRQGSLPPADEALQALLARLRSLPVTVTRPVGR
jgi:non-specific serine/threonine protein kinase/serine/threonine-protein kinase